MTSLKVSMGVSVAPTPYPDKMRSANDDPLRSSALSAVKCLLLTPAGSGCNLAAAHGILLSCGEGRHVGCARYPEGKMPCEAVSSERSRLSGFLRLEYRQTLQVRGPDRCPKLWVPEPHWHVRYGAIAGSQLENHIHIDRSNNSVAQAKLSTYI